MEEAWSEQGSGGVKSGEENDYGEGIDFDSWASEKRQDDMG